LLPTIGIAEALSIPTDQQDFDLAAVPFTATFDDDPTISKLNVRVPLGDGK
jgi:hypothetical protein